MPWARPRAWNCPCPKGLCPNCGAAPRPSSRQRWLSPPAPSGGGLFNAAGELVGITTFYLKEGQNLNFALPVEWIAEAAGEKIQERPITKVPIAPARPQDRNRAA